MVGAAVAQPQKDFIFPDIETRLNSPKELSLEGQQERRGKEMLRQVGDDVE